MRAMHVATGHIFCCARVGEMTLPPAIRGVLPTSGVPFDLCRQSK